MMTLWVIYNPSYKQSGVILTGKTKESVVSQWENIYQESWSDSFPNLKCELFELCKI